VHKSLLASEVTLTGNSYVSVSPSRYPTFTANLAIVATLSQTVNNNGYLLFYGTSDRLRNLAVYLHSNSTVTTLTFYYTDNTGDLRWRHLRFSPSLADGNEHCLAINVNPSQFTVYVDGTSVGFREISSPDFSYGVRLYFLNLSKFFIDLQSTKRYINPSLTFTTANTKLKLLSH